MMLSLRHLRRSVFSNGGERVSVWVGALGIGPQPPELMFDESNNRSYYELVGEPMRLTKDPAMANYWTNADFPSWKGDKPRRARAPRLRLRSLIGRTTGRWVCSAEVAAEPLCSQSLAVTSSDALVRHNGR